MRAVFVNHMHPETPHVSAVRVAAFARALATRGHHVILLSETRTPDDPGTSIGELKRSVEERDWNTPLFVACRPSPDTALKRLHRGGWPWGLRQGVVAANFVLRSGVFGHWRRGAQPLIRAIVEDFRPDVVWGSLGNTDVWNIARDLAHRADCPWVGDLKDNWERFVPFGLRRIQAARYRDAAAFTAFSDMHGLCVRQWLGAEARTVYSGFPLSWLEENDTPERKRAGFTIALAGSLYDGASVAVFAEGLRTWLRGRRSEAPVAIQYHGGDHGACRRLLGPVEALCTMRIDPPIPVSDLRAVQRRADVNIHPYFAPTLFHHKTIELMAMGRPIIAVPGESEECRNIARQVGISFHPCGTPAEVATALQSVEETAEPRVDFNVLARYSWDRQAEVLESVLENTLNRSPHVS